MCLGRMLDRSEEFISFPHNFCSIQTNIYLMLFSNVTNLHPKETHDFEIIATLVVS